MEAETIATTAAIILAAGKGTRMRSRLPKVLHCLAGRPMLLHIADMLATFADVQPLYVLGHEERQVRAALDPAALSVVQREQRGTGHAVLTALPVIPSETQRALILYGDVPLLRADTLRALLDDHRAVGATISLLTVVMDDPTGYGRIVREGSDGPVARIVEQKELTDAQQAIREINAGIYCVDVSWLRAAMSELPTHGDDEMYLTDLVELAHRQGLTIQARRLNTPIEVMGVNTRVQLAEAEAEVRRRINEELMLSGVTLIDPAATYIDVGVRVGQDTVIHPQTYLQGTTEVGPDCLIGPGSVIVSSRIGSGCRVISSVVEEAVMGDRVSVGPFAHLRPGTDLADDVEVGNYSEIKNSRVGPRTKMHHVGYVGDATVGADVNIGAAAVVCNYDGTRKHRTVIDDGVFVGSGTLLRAPVRLRVGSRTGAGAVVLHDVDPGVTVAGVPARPLGQRADTGDGGATAGGERHGLRRSDDAHS